MRRGQAFKVTTDEDRKRVLELAKWGENGLAIAKATGIPKTTVYAILAKRTAAPPRPARGASRSAPKARSHAKPMPRPPAEQEEQEEQAPAPAVTADAPLDVLRRELAELQRRIKRARDGSAKAHLEAVKGFAAIAEIVRRLEPPPPPPPPDEDPENLALKEQLRERLERLRADTMVTPQGRAQVRAYIDALDAQAAAAERGEAA